MLMRISTYFKSILLLVFFSVSTLGSDLVYAKHGMVVSASELASEVGVEILKKGGNAVDAAVAVGFALAVTYPSAGNLGGGGFMVIHLADGSSTSIDFRETAPIQSHRSMFLDDSGNYDQSKSLEEVSSSGVPGSVSGLLTTLEKYGTLQLAEVIQPAIDIAENGFEIEYWLVKSINAYNKEFNEYESSKRIFTDKGDTLEINHRLVQKELAATLRLIRDKGIEGFYSGSVAEKIIAVSEQHNGYLTFEDLEKYQAIERFPVIGKYGELEIIGMPLPSAGGIGIIQSLNVFSKFNFENNKFASADYIHTVSEILKHVYADRAQYLGDQDFVDVPVDYLLSEKRANKIFDSINFHALPSSKLLPEEELIFESEETTHYSVIDRHRNAVSTTVSLNSSYGNKIVVDGAGFLMNNHMDDFTAKVGVKNQFGLVGSKANSIEPGKRMLSSMSPTIVTKNNKPYLVVGSPGGSKIIISVLQVILNVVNFGMDIREAINKPRFHHQWLPDNIQYEKFGMPEDVRKNLAERGHDLEEVEIIGRVQGVLYDFENEIIWGASDKRGFGKAIGF